MSATRLSALYRMHLILSHSKYAKLSQLSWTEHSLWWQLIRIDGLHTPLLSLALSSHLLIGHDVLHYHVFVFFPDCLVQFLFIVTDQLLDVYVVLGEGYVVVVLAIYWVDLCWVAT